MVSGQRMEARREVRRLRMNVKSQEKDDKGHN